MTVATRVTIAKCFARLGQYGQAMAAHQSIAKILERAGLSSSVEYGVLLGDIGDILCNMGSLSESEKYLKRGLSMLRLHLLPDDTTIASTLRSLAIVQQRLGCKEEAAESRAAGKSIERRSQTRCAGPGCARKMREDGAPLDVCVKCRRTFYCSKECQTVDWKREGGHKAECRALIAEGKAAAGEKSGGDGSSAAT